MNNLHVWLEATRPKTLPAALAPVLLASALAKADGGFDWRAALICLAFALLIQIGTNFANDYLDGIKGTDTNARIGPQRAVASGLVTPATMKRVTIVTLAVAFCLGLALIPFGGWWLLAVGVSSVTCAWLYTGGPYPLAYNGLGDLFVVLFFGLIAVGCTYYVQTGGFTLDVFLLGLGCGLLVNNILIVNNYRDLDEDRQAGKRTLVVKLGRRWALRQYAASSLFAGSVVFWFILRGYGWYLLPSLVPVALGFRQAIRLPDLNGPCDFLGALKASGQVVALYGVLFSLGLVLA
ncbi:1,4-dihydroxy-2-naphthoate polyprenyltransferase [Coraliomargarita parva]|uniref:1,4-dihydroxy-2-naphthoate polyprenyltransferase n=1 Tax=Coraliomargarita parva TaxID=3014050 RepID=UPI0022B3F2DA|nr:1,4-dihydroxy-2-naphthoate polyprenyltransferase [Coraliomargarita parva]